MNDNYNMEKRINTHGSEWPYFELLHSLKNAKSSKKVFLVDTFRNAATLKATRLAALLQRGNKNADFSIIDLIHSIPSLIEVNSYHLKDTRRQLQHFNQAPLWRNGTPELQATFYQLAMQDAEQKSGGNLIHTPFTLNLTPEFVRKALQHKAGFIDYTKRQIDKAMLPELVRKPQYWFTVELVPVIGSHTRGQQRPHLHGGILLKPSEKESVRNQKAPISRAFHKAAGKCSPDFSNRLLNLSNHKIFAKQNGISEIEAAINWAGYAFKLNTFARLYLSSKTNLTADNGTKRQAEALYALLSQRASKISSSDKNTLDEFLALAARNSTK